VIDLGDVSGLAQRCLAADGGLPLAVEEWFLRRRWAGPDVITDEVRDENGQLIAAGAVKGGEIYTGLVDPAARGRGLGSRLLDWGLALAAPAAAPPPDVSAVTVESEGLSAPAEQLFASRGLTRVFAEHVMRIEIGPDLAAPSWPAGTELATWSAATTRRFHAVYDASFRERPHFPGLSAEEWISDVEGDDDFHPAYSILATVSGLGDAGFVTGEAGWIIQVGTIPAARGRGLAAALILESLRRMRGDGETEGWLSVNADNASARRVYERLGFACRGTRARYALKR
jgi:ribosomal protein S18 acetylase RimI-like enzyme